MFVLERGKDHNPLFVVELLNNISKIYRVNVCKGFFQHFEFDITFEAADMRRQWLDIHPGYNTAVMRVFLRGKYPGEESKPQPAEPGGFARHYFGHVKF